MDLEGVLGAVCELARDGWGPVLPLRALADRLDCLLVELASPLAELAGRGMVEPWESAPGGARVALTPWLCEQIHVSLDEPATPRRHAGTLTVAETDLPGLADSGVAEVWRLDELADPSAADPVQVAIEEEAAYGYAWEPNRADYEADRPPRPRVLYGERLHWPVPGQDGTFQPTIATSNICPGCHSRRILRVGYCLICDRYGAWDALKGVIEPAEEKGNAA